MGQRITLQEDGTLLVPDTPVIPYIEGDGIGPDVWQAARPVLDAAIEKAYGGKRRIEWLEIPAGEKARQGGGESLPAESLETIRSHRVAIKGPLMTPVGKGFRSVNVMLRLELDLYACVRPVSYFPPVPSPMKQPQLVDMIIFRENTEDVYLGIEWEAGSKEAAELIQCVKRLGGRDIRPDSGIGLKPISKAGTERLVRMAIEEAIRSGRESVTLVHKGNIMKHTEGAFRGWGYELAAREFGDKTITEAQVKERYAGKAPEGKIVIKDRIADAMFQEALLHPERYSVLALPNLNGDYMSDALAAMVGGLGLAPGANIGKGHAVFEATHGTAPDLAGKDAANPGSLMLSGAMMLQYLGWDSAGRLVADAVKKAVAARNVTPDLAEHMENATTVGCAEFGSRVRGFL